MHPCRGRLGVRDDAKLEGKCFSFSLPLRRSVVFLKGNRGPKKKSKCNLKISSSDSKKSDRRATHASTTWNFPRGIVHELPSVAGTVSRSGLKATHMRGSPTNATRRIEVAADEKRLLPLETCLSVSKELRDQFLITEPDFLVHALQQYPAVRLYLAGNPRRVTSFFLSFLFLFNTFEMGVSPWGPTLRYSFGRCRSRGTDTWNIHPANVGYFSGHFIESDKYTRVLLI